MNWDNENGMPEGIVRSIVEGSSENSKDNVRVGRGGDRETASEPGARATPGGVRVRPPGSHGLGSPASPPGQVGGAGSEGPVVLPEGGSMSEDYGTVPPGTEKPLRIRSGELHTEMKGSPATAKQAWQSPAMRRKDLYYKAMREICSGCFFVALLFALFVLKALWVDHNAVDAEAYGFIAVTLAILSQRRQW